MGKKESDIEDDIFVRKERIIELFDPPLPEGTFYDWRKQGKVVPARYAKGYYAWNATRKKLGLPLDDVNAYRKKMATAGDRKLQVVYVALSLVVPEILQIISEIDCPDALTPAEIKKIRKFAEVHQVGIEEFGDDSLARLAYCRAALDAEKMNQQMGDAE